MKLVCPPFVKLFHCFYLTAWLVGPVLSDVMMALAPPPIAHERPFTVYAALAAGTILVPFLVFLVSYVRSRVAAIILMSWTVITVLELYALLARGSSVSEFFYFGLAFQLIAVFCLFAPSSRAWLWSRRTPSAPASRIEPTLSI